MRAMWLWESLRHLFDTDDGSLPEIRVTYSSRGSAAAGYELLRKRAACVPENAPREATADRIPFHAVLAGIEAQGSSLPDLGVFVFDDQLALDYRMGARWSASSLIGLFTLLSELVALDPAALVARVPSGDSSAPDRFASAWNRWSDENAS